MDRTAQNPLTLGEGKELMLVVQQGVMLDEIAPGLARRNIGSRKAQLQELVAAVCRADPTADEVRGVLRLLAVKFVSSTRLALEQSGYRIFKLPHGLTIGLMSRGLAPARAKVRFHSIPRGFPVGWSENLTSWGEELPTRATEIAWRPQILEESRDRNLVEHRAMLQLFDGSLPEKCRSALPSAEEASFVFDECGRRGYFDLPRGIYLRCRNRGYRGTLRIADLGEGGISIIGMSYGGEGDPQLGHVYLSPFVIPWQ